MASNREERFLMRQRGAGTRQLRDSGFALDIPNAASTPLQPQPSAGSRRTSRNQQQATPKSTPRTHTKKQTPQSARDHNRQLGMVSASPASQATRMDSQGSVRKKRRLAMPIEDTPEEEAAEELEGIEEEAEEEAEGEAEEEAEEEAEAEAKEEAEEEDAASEVLVEPTAEDLDLLSQVQRKTISVTPAKRRKKRKSIGQQSLRKKPKSVPRPLPQYDIQDENSASDAAAHLTPRQEVVATSVEDTTASQSTTKKRKSAAQKGPLEPADDNIERAGPEGHVEEVTDPPTLLKKRGRPAGKRVTELLEANERDEATENTVTPNSEKRRGRPRKSDVSIATGESPIIVKSTGKPRGRPRKSDIATPSKTTGQPAEEPNRTTSRERRKNHRQSNAADHDDSNAEVDQVVEQPKPRGRPRKSNVANTPANDSAQPTPSQDRASRGKKRKIDALETADGRNGKKAATQTEPASISKPRGRPRKVDGLASTQRHDRSVPALVSKPRGRPRKSDVSVAAQQGADETPARPRGRPSTSDGLATSVTPRPRPRARSVPARGRSMSPGANSQSKKKNKSGSIPVLVHRLSGAQGFNFIEDDEDDLAGPAPLMKKAGVNAVDVLSQICREIVAKSLETLNLNAQKEQGSKRAEWKRKRKVVELFNENLQATLLKMTTTLDNNSGLTMRLKQVNKAKAAHREELLELRQEREELAIQMDAIRIQHGRSTESAKGANDLNTALHDIELAVQRGRAAQQNADEQDQIGELGLEARIQQAVEEVSSADGRQGLLEKVKRYNAYLEAAVGLL